MAVQAKSEFKSLKAKGFITPKILFDYDLMSKYSLHGRLVYCLLEASSQAGIIGVPEVKIHFAPPLDPNPLAKWRQTKRKLNFKKVDVAYYEQNLRFLGFSEVVTLDRST